MRRSNATSLGSRPSGESRLSFLSRWRAVRSAVADRVRGTLPFDRLGQWTVARRVAAPLLLRRIPKDEGVRATADLLTALHDVRLPSPIRKRSILGCLAEQERFAQVEGEFKPGLLRQKSGKFLYGVKLNIIDHDVSPLLEHVRCIE